jgi:hypothetical protein
MLGRETISIFGRADGGRKSGKEFGSLVGFFVFLPLLALVAVLQLPFLPIVALWERSQQKRLLQQMTKQNRVMQWSEFVQALQEKRGTLIIEGEWLNGAIWWWTEEDVRAASPPSFSESTLGTVREKQLGCIPFRRWCYERYTNPTNGRAFLIVGDDKSKLDLLEKQPETPVIDTRRPSRRSRKRQTPGQIE